MSARPAEKGQDGTVHGPGALMNALTGALERLSAGRALQQTKRTTRSELCLTAKRTISSLRLRSRHGGRRASQPLSLKGPYVRCAIG